MWVRTQSRLSLIETSVIKADIKSNKDGKCVIWIPIFSGSLSMNVTATLGEYSTTYQCMDILDEIQERINEGCPFVYQMPEDVDVLEKAIKKREEVEEAVEKFKEGFK